jgi:hypothetical protein
MQSVFDGTSSDARKWRRSFAELKRHVVSARRRSGVKLHVSRRSVAKKPKGNWKKTLHSEKEDKETDKEVTQMTVRCDME